MSPGPIQLDQATALTLMLGPNGSVGIQASTNEAPPQTDQACCPADRLIGEILAGPR